MGLVSLIKDFDYITDLVGYIGDLCRLFQGGFVGCFSDFVVEVDIKPLYY